MATSLIYVLCVPEDYAWAYELVGDLQSDGYTVYLEPPDVDPNDFPRRQQTADALYSAKAMLVVLTEMSVVGPSSTIFEAWWRPFLTNGGTVIPCISPEAPVGEKNWMPFDLVRLPRVDFRQAEGYGKLRGILQSVGLVSTSLPRHPMPKSSTPKPPSPPPPPPLAPNFQAASVALVPFVEPKPEYEGPPQEFSVKNVSAPLPSTKSDQKVSSPRGLLNFLSITVLVAALLMAWVFVWQFANRGIDNTSALYWTVGIIAFVVLVMLWRRTARIQQHYQANLQRPLKRHLPQRGQVSRTQRITRPRIYVEVLESGDPEDVGLILPIQGESIVIGRGNNADLSLSDRGVEREHCRIYYHPYSATYHLKNLTQKRTVLYLDPLALNESRTLQNGDLIALGNSVVLQFRAHAD